MQCQLPNTKDYIFEPAKSLINDYELTCSETLTNFGEINEVVEHIKNNGVSTIADEVKLEFTNQIDSKSLPPVQFRKLKALLDANEDIFGKGPQDLKHTNVVQHYIDTSDTAPINQRAYRIPDHQKKILDEEIDKILQNDVIEESVQSIE